MSLILLVLDSYSELYEEYEKLEKKYEKASKKGIHTCTKCLTLEKEIERTSKKGTHTCTKCPTLEKENVVLRSTLKAFSTRMDTLDISIKESKRGYENFFKGQKKLENVLTLQRAHLKKESLGYDPSLYYKKEND